MPCAENIANLRGVRRNERDNVTGPDPGKEDYFHLQLALSLACEMFLMIFRAILYILCTTSYSSYSF